MVDVDEINSSSSNEEEEPAKIWNIKYIEEKMFWNNILIGEYIYESKVCPSSKSYSLNLKENKPENILNPYYVRCSKKNCRRKYILRHFSFFKLHPNIPTSIITYIINEFIVMNSNAIEIKKGVKKNLNMNLIIIDY